jgi:hypothetical protein
MRQSKPQLTHFCIESKPPLRRGLNPFAAASGIAVLNCCSAQDHL